MAKEMTAFDAAMIADGEFEMTGFEETDENYFAAYQYLIDTGMAWTLQGRIGRQAMALIEAGHCHPAAPVTESSEEMVD